MDEGILVKAYNFLLKKQATPQTFDTANWAGYFMSLGMSVHTGRINWDERTKLLDLKYDTTANCINNISRASANSEIQLFREVKEGNSKTHKLVSKEKSEWLCQHSYIQEIAKSAKIEEITDPTYPPLQLIKYINSTFTQQDAIKTLIEHIVLTGNAFWIIDYNGTIPSLIRFVMPNFFYEIEEDAAGKPLKYWYTEDNRKKSMDAKNVVHFANYGSWSTTWGAGMSYISSGWANIEKNLLTYLNTNLTNHGIPAGLVHFKTKIPDATFQAFQKQFNEMYAGIEKSAKLAFSNGGDYEIEKLGYTPDEMGIEVTWRLAREAIANSHGVPISMLSNPSNRSVVQGQDVQFLRDTVQPLLMLISQSLTEKLLPLYSDVSGMFFAAKDIVKEDQRAALEERETNLETGLTTRNEERAAMGIEPSPNPLADELLVPSNLVPLGQQPPPPQGQLARQIIDGIMEKMKQKEIRHGQD